MMAELLVWNPKLSTVVEFTATEKFDTWRNLLLTKFAGRFDTARKIMTDPQLRGMSKNFISKILTLDESYNNMMSYQTMFGENPEITTNEEIAERFINIVDGANFLGITLHHMEPLAEYTLRMKSVTINPIPPTYVLTTYNGIYVLEKVDGEDITFDKVYATGKLMDSMNEVLRASLLNQLQQMKNAYDITLRERAIRLDEKIARQIERWGKIVTDEEEKNLIADEEFAKSFRD